MTIYYNEWEPYPAQWLRNLIKAGHLPAGDVDERDIRDVLADDLKGYDQCHFFAGIGGWPLALEWAGWEGPVWTGSCPCQPLSSAGQRKGHADERHLWPAFYKLIAERSPATVFGEQVASKDGREWLSGIRADLEGLGYAIGAADLPAAGVGAPHIRQRLWWVANADQNRRRWNSKRFFEAEAACSKFADNCTNGFAHFCNYAICKTDDGQRLRFGRFSPDVVNGLPRSMGARNAYGNAIVPQVAAEFISAFMECRP